MLLSASPTAKASVTHWSIIALSWALVIDVVVGVVVPGVDLVVPTDSGVLSPVCAVYSSVSVSPQVVPVERCPLLATPQPPSRVLRL
ncbi:hypothetical protein Tco_1209547 [Tanacetum coccineum]